MNQEDEYRSLREEILRLEKENVSITLYVLTGTLLAAGLIIQNNTYNIVLPLIYQFLLIWGLRRYTTSRRLRLRLSTYINIFIEPNHKDLNWENNNIIFKSSEKRKLKSAFIHFTDIFTLLTIIGIIVTVLVIVEHFYKNNPSYFEYVLLSIIIIAHFAELYLLYFNIRMPSDKEYIEIWEKVKNKNAL